MNNMGSVSDGYHTFDELYEHRNALWIALAREIRRNPEYQYGRRVWRSLNHSNGVAIEGWFLLGVGTEKGEQMTYHLPDKLWVACDFADTLELAPDFDGHAPADVVKRVNAL